MTLISLLLVLALERTGFNGHSWHVETYTGRYYHFLLRQGIVKDQSTPWVILGVALLPALLLLAVLQMLDMALIELAVSVLLLLVAIGCPLYRASYKGYLQASARGDVEGSNIYAEQMGYVPRDDYSFGQHLMWINYRHYAAVMIWFAVFGAAGALLYVLTRSLVLMLEEDQHPASIQAQQVLEWLDWVPVRVAAFGLLIVGHFSKALPVWVTSAGNAGRPARSLLTEVAQAAEVIEPEELSCNTEPCAMVALAKRNTLFLLVMLSLLSLAGLLP
ncbi:Protein AmpE [Saliniradius amylolyticus]|uniref:Protein AmpE n=1 Tax=Saliniradius amylolyticus TaxID=2183582 RepID=A0A2S2E5H0_9ALTE|nr:beta-lactamase regulator AmpE [Saliniradius amylolyticus]AWL12904.1 Protein AmpE [Saliniradius amylolyticus]